MRDCFVGHFIFSTLKSCNGYIYGKCMKTHFSVDLFCFLKDLDCCLYIVISSSTAVASSGFLSSLIFPVNFGNLNAKPKPSFNELIPAAWEGLNVISEAMTSITILGSNQTSIFIPVSTRGCLCGMTYFSKSLKNCSRLLSVKPVPTFVVL